ncbi:MAG: murein L,D-transpeptidase catalytic domain family protein [Crocinitomicaceae bacterium]
MMNVSNGCKTSIFLFCLILLPSLSFGLERDETDPVVKELLKQDSVLQKAQMDFDVYTRFLYREIGEKELSYVAFKQGVIGYTNLMKRGELQRLDTLTIIDFSKPSNQVRLFIVDLCQLKVIHKSLCSHGVNSGRLYAERFSNKNNSHQSSLGFYVTSTTYSGKYDLALRLKGMEHSNSHASSRGVVMHAADYATYDFLERNACQLGRSYGCPAVPFNKFEEVVSWIKEGSCMFIYYPSRSYKRYSKYLNNKSYLEDFVEV